jgi:hypothetical protein
MGLGMSLKLEIRQSNERIESRMSKAVETSVTNR